MKKLLLAGAAALAMMSAPIHAETIQLQSSGNAGSFIYGLLRRVAEEVQRYDARGRAEA